MLIQGVYRTIVAGLLAVGLLAGVASSATIPEDVESRFEALIDALNNLQELPIDPEQVDDWFADKTHPLRVTINDLQNEIAQLEQRIEQLQLLHEESRSLLGTLERARELIHRVVGVDTMTPVAEESVVLTEEIHPGWVVIEANCVSCHNAEQPSGGLDLTSTEALMAGGDRGDAIVPGDPENSLLYQMVIHEVEPAMPFFADPLPQEEVDLIAQWIQDGAPIPGSTEATGEPIQETLSPEGSEHTPVSVAEAHDGEIVFAQDVFPVLEQSCVGCHGPDQNMGMLRLDSRAIAFEGGLHGPAIVPGDPEASELYKRLTTEDEGLRMPLGGEPLPPEQIAVIRTWIEEGAHWPERIGAQIDEVEKHWAYVKPELPERPEVSGDEWVRNPIDRFVLDQLNELGLEPAPEADRETLLRRVSLDLTGLPPTLDELDTFLNDESPKAYENAVNRLLSSPHYGERWAVPWLDLARYADSNGYEKDGFRTMWPYRQWVIESFNRDQPFDQFTVEQIAGDMLPGSTLDQQIATGFNRNTMINLEGGVNQEEYRIAAVMDRVHTTSTVWLGTTMACAQCHNHKYDPFTQKEYYEFMAFFNNSAPEIRQVQSFEAVEDSPKVQVPTVEQRLLIDSLDRKLAELRDTYYRSTPELEEAKHQWEESVLAGKVEWSPVDVTVATSIQGATLTIREDASVFASGITPATDTYTLEVTLPAGTLTALQVEALTDERLPSMGPGRTGHANFVLSEIEVTLEGDSSPLGLTNPSASFEAEDYGIARSIDGDTGTGWAIHPRKGEPFQAVFEVAEPLALETPKNATVVLKQWHGGRHVIGRFRLSTTDAALPVEASTIPQPIVSLLDVPANMRSEDEAETIDAYFREVTPLLADIRTRMNEIREQWPDDISTTMVMRERDERRETRIFGGGSYLNPQDPVLPAVPSVLHDLPPDQSADRLALARWLVDRENPLTARVTVNRIWEQIFGHGIVKTTEDFGTRSPAPVNPELLDWLAIQFMKHGWSQKSLLYLLVTSSAYRQASVVTPAKLEADPENRFLSRGARFRLPAEFIRDQALRVSGKLNPKLGGPSVFPFQPEGIWQMPYSSAKWVMDDDGNQFRRGLYTHWQRTAPYPAFVTFDAPSREVTCPRRIRTNTPLQALVVLNDPAFFGLAQALAVRMETEADARVEKQIEHGFRLTLSRSPSEWELQRLVTYFDEQLNYYKQNPEEAGQVITQEPVAESVVHRAALTLVANVLLNLDETVTKG